MSNRKVEFVSLASRKEERTHSGYQVAGTYDRPDMKVCSALHQFVTRHVLKSLVPALIEQKAARFAVIQGMPGTGKSETVRVALSRSGVDLIMVPACDLSGETEGAPIAALKELEAAVLAITARTSRPIAICFDDFDCSNAFRRSGTEYTVNQQLTEGYFQFLADSGGLRTADGKQASVIMTGNDFSSARASLLRPGRADFYTHTVSFEDKIAIISALFQGLDERSIRSLVKAYPYEPIAFFKSVRTKLFDDTLDALHRAHGFDVAAIDAALRDRPTVIELAKIRAAAQQCSTAKAGSFLGRL